MQNNNFKHKYKKYLQKIAFLCGGIGEIYEAEIDIDYWDKYSNITSNPRSGTILRGTQFKQIQDPPPGFPFIYMNIELAPGKYVWIKNRNIKMVPLMPSLRAPLAVPSLRAPLAVPSLRAPLAVPLQTSFRIQNFRGLDLLVDSSSRDELIIDWNFVNQKFAESYTPDPFCSLCLCARFGGHQDAKHKKTLGRRLNGVTAWNGKSSGLGGFVTNNPCTHYFLVIPNGHVPTYVAPPGPPPNALDALIRSGPNYDLINYLIMTQKLALEYARDFILKFPALAGITIKLGELDYSSPSNGRFYDLSKNDLGTLYLIYHYEKNSMPHLHCHCFISFCKDTVSMTEHSRINITQNPFMMSHEYLLKSILGINSMTLPIIFI
jgi:hypothetical protein